MSERFGIRRGWRPHAPNPSSKSRVTTRLGLRSTDILRRSSPKDASSGSPWPLRHIAAKQPYVSRMAFVSLLFVNLKRSMRWRRGRLRLRDFRSDLRGEDDSVS